MAELKALLVGIDDYGDPRNNLNSCLADVREFQDRLTTRYGFPAQQIRILLDAAATIRNVEDELDRLIADVGPDDRLVFVYSGHGFQVPTDGTLTEVLVLHDGSFSDDVLSARTQGLPPGVLTVLLDSCHSGGMEKVFALPRGIEVARAKVWSPGEAQAADVNKAVLAGGLEAVRPFGCAPIVKSSVGAAVQGFAPSAVTVLAPRSKGGDEQGQVALNAVLVTACREDETASARRSDTKGLSAFTFAWCEAMDQLGPDSSPRALHARAEQILTAMSFRQRPVLFAPQESPESIDRSAFLGKPLPAATTNGAVSGIPAIIESAIREALDNLRKDTTMPALTTTASADVDEKFVSLLPQLIPPMITGIGELFKSGEGAAKGAVDEKFLDLIPDILPSVIAGVGQLLKSAPAAPAPAAKSVAPAAEDVDEKILPLVVSMIPGIVSGVASLLKSAPSAKAAAPEPEVDEKFLGIVTSIVREVVPHVARALR